MNGTRALTHDEVKVIPRPGTSAVIMAGGSFLGTLRCSLNSYQAELRVDGGVEVRRTCPTREETLDRFLRALWEAGIAGMVEVVHREVAVRLPAPEVS